MMRENNESAGINLLPSKKVTTKTKTNAMSKTNTKTKTKTKTDEKDAFEF